MRQLRNYLAAAVTCAAIGVLGCGNAAGPESPSESEPAAVGETIEYSSTSSGLAGACTPLERAWFNYKCYTPGASGEFVGSSCFRHPQRYCACFDNYPQYPCTVPACSQLVMPCVSQ